MDIEIEVLQANGSIRTQDKTQEAEAEVDPWKLPEVHVEYTKWSELSCCGKVKRMAVGIGKVILLLGCLYFFICSLDLLSKSFRLIGGKTAGSVFQHNDILSNPVAGLMIGVLATVLLQSSSTTTGIAISMAVSKVLTVRDVIPIVMGANIGTSTTNTFVSLGQITKKDEFRRAFAGATVHDMFNWLTVLVFLPLEAVTGYLYYLTKAILSSVDFPKSKEKQKSLQLLKTITKPFTNLIMRIHCTAGHNVCNDGTYEGLQDNKFLPALLCHVIHGISFSFGALTSAKSLCKYVYGSMSFHLDKRVLSDIAIGKEEAIGTSIIKHCCKSNNIPNNSSFTDWNSNTSNFDNDSRSHLEGLSSKVCVTKCQFMFESVTWSDTTVGIVLLILTLILLSACFFTLVRTLYSVMRGPILALVRRFINADFPGVFGYFTGYIAILIGTGTTMVIQSSSVLTSALTPLVGIGILSIERMYPLTLGANLGTTFTAVIIALSQNADDMHVAFHVALCHVFFNISGVLLFYPVPITRLPIRMAKFLGNKTAKYRWFAVAYLLLLFVILPAVVFGLSSVSWVALVAVAAPVILFLICITTVNYLQTKRPEKLPEILRTWNFLPLWLRSLEPYDNIIRKICCKCFRRN